MSGRTQDPPDQPEKRLTDCGRCGGNCGSEDVGEDGKSMLYLTHRTGAAVPLCAGCVEWLKEMRAAGRSLEADREIEQADPAGAPGPGLPTVPQGLTEELTQRGLLASRSPAKQEDEGGG